MTEPKFIFVRDLKSFTSEEISKFKEDYDFDVDRIIYSRINEEFILYETGEVVYRLVSNKPNADLVDDDDDETELYDYLINEIFILRKRTTIDVDNTITTIPKCIFGLNLYDSTDGYLMYPKSIVLEYKDAFSLESRKTKNADRFPGKRSTKHATYEFPELSDIQIYSGHLFQILIKIADSVYKDQWNKFTDNDKDGHSKNKTIDNVIVCEILNKFVTEIWLERELNNIGDDPSKIYLTFVYEDYEYTENGNPLPEEIDINFNAILSEEFDLNDNDEITLFLDENGPSLIEYDLTLSRL